MHDNLAPSYRQIAIAILKHDHALTSLGFTAEVSPWYIALKRIELAEREPSAQREFDFMTGSGE